MRVTLVIKATVTENKLYLHANSCKKITKIHLPTHILALFCMYRPVTYKGGDVIMVCDEFA